MFFVLDPAPYNGDRPLTAGRSLNPMTARNAAKSGNLLVNFVKNAGFAPKRRHLSCPKCRPDQKIEKISKKSEKVVASSEIADILSHVDPILSACLMFSTPFSETAETVKVARLE